MPSLAFSITILIMLTVWGLKTKYPLAFMLAFPVALVSGCMMRHIFATPESLVVSVVLIFYGWTMAGAALVAMFSEKENEDGQD